ncbi:hypothetical protein THAOC_07912 [Thalassiosira oceanica]|uniref:Uncharacterized protein n=1 Tax=Thalassiosira oceanica TaxID=159749 RepID=K0TJG5_THAOC|nr:hypothetical protein THAOC_07912 [Thalassiosira oceanica]|eukprot:EJK70707.1 hypothetical protein THAOC_07912 [Thalassiosira oceanica]
MIVASATGPPAVGRMLMVRIKVLRPSADTLDLAVGSVLMDHGAESYRHVLILARSCHKQEMVDRRGIDGRPYWPLLQVLSAQPQLFNAHIILVSLPIRRLRDRRLRPSSPLYWLMLSPNDDDGVHRPRWAPRRHLQRRRRLRGPGQYVPRARERPCGPDRRATRARHSSSRASAFKFHPCFHRC